MSGKKLLPGFADDEEDQEDQIKETEADVTTLFRECERRLKEMSRTKSEGSADEVSVVANESSARASAATRADTCRCVCRQQSVRKNIERRVAQQLQDLGGEYRHGRRVYNAKLKGQTIEEYRPDLSINGSAGAGPSGSGGFFDDDEPASTAGVADPRFSAAQTLQLVMAERQTEEREKAITQVSPSLPASPTRPAAPRAPPSACRLTCCCCPALSVCAGDRVCG